jgi:hypothetical protein
MITFFEGKFTIFSIRLVYMWRKFLRFHWSCWSNIHIYKATIYSRARHNHFPRANTIITRYKGMKMTGALVRDNTSEVLRLTFWFYRLSTSITRPLDSNSLIKHKSMKLKSHGLSLAHPTTTTTKKMINNNSKKRKLYLYLCAYITSQCVCVYRSDYLGNLNKSALTWRTLGLTLADVKLLLSWFFYDETSADDGK